MKILLIDDEQEILDAVEKILIKSLKMEKNISKIFKTEIIYKTIN